MCKYIEVFASVSIVRLPIPVCQMSKGGWLLFGLGWQYALYDDIEQVCFDLDAETYTRCTHFSAVNSI